MYNEERRPINTIVSILIKFIILVAFTFLLVWLFPTKQSLNPLYQDVFRNNIDSMREAAETYFTNDRLPKNVGDSVRITLKEMEEKNLLLPFVDRYGKECDKEKSYVEITKTATEYEMKVNLVCSKESSFVIEHMGCTDKCTKCSTDTSNTTSKTNSTTKNNNNNNNNDNKNTVAKEYQYQKEVQNKVVSEYKCDKGYTLKGKICYKDETTTDKVAATATYKTVEATESPIEKTRTVNATYSAWSDWGENKEYDPNNNSIVWGEQELVWNEKNGAKKVTTTKTVVDKNSPIYQITYDNVVGTYKQYVCSGYNYFRDSSTSTTYKYTDWVLQGTKKMSSIPDNTNTTKYVVTGMDFESCSKTCTIKPYYLVKVYTRSITKVTSSASELSATCQVEEKTITVYGKKKTFVGYYDTERTITVSYKYLYHTKTRTKLTNGGTEKYLICKDGTTPVNNKCKTTKTVISGYTCPTGYTRIGTSCYKDTVKTVSKDATPVYKTVTSIEYKWSTETSLKGWTATGKTRSI